MKIKHCNVALFVPHAGCPHQCSFCNQRHIAGTATPLTPAAVSQACERALETMVVSAADAEIAFFGGSFTAIDRAYMTQLLSAAEPYVSSGRFAGIRLSTRPDAIDPQVLALLRGYGVTTIELGAQSMNDAVLAENRRGHTAQQVRDAAHLIRGAGFSLGLQMMTGLPGDTDEGARKTAAELAALQPDVVRIYPTVVIDHTPLAERYCQGNYRPQSLEEAIELCSDLLYYFEEEQQIPVIRLGLHAEEEMREHYFAGPFHPAFRERCESRLLLKQIKNELCGRQARVVRVVVSPLRLSQAIGQRKENVLALQEQGYTVQIAADAALNRKDMRVEVIE